MDRAGLQRLRLRRRIRFHSDNSLLIRYYNNPAGLLSKAAFSFTGDLGFESGAGVTPFVGGTNGATCGNAGQQACTQNFIAAMLYNRCEYITWVLELVHRHASVPYFAGRGGVTSASGYLLSGATSNGDLNYKPDLQKDETRINLAHACALLSDGHRVRSHSYCTSI